MTKTVNLPQEYFHCPELSKRERLYLIQKAQDSAKALVESARSSNGPVRWIEAGTHKGVQMYKGEGRNPTTASEQIQYVCGATTVQATIEEVASFMDVSTTAKFKAYVPHQHELLDGVVLYTLVPPGPESQYLHQVTIKWSAAHIPSKLIKNRDFLTLECQDVFTDTSGRRGWVRSYHSVKLPCCPDLQTELDFVRGSFYHTGYVFVESERPGWLDCIHTCQVNLKGQLKLPSSVYFLAMRRRIGSVAELGKTLQRRRLGKQTFLSDLELVPKRTRSRCHVCAAKFGMLTRKSRCRKCGEVVCGQCTQTWEVSLPKAGVKKVRVCATCASMRENPSHGSNGMQLDPKVMDEISLLSSMSHDSEQYSPDFEYNDTEHQVPLQLKSTIHEEPEYDAYHPSPPNRAPVHTPGRASQHYASHQPPRPSQAGRSYDPEPYRPIGFVHHSEYERPSARFEHAPPPPPDRMYPGDLHRESGDYMRGYGLPSLAPRHQSEYQRYPDEYSSRYAPAPHHHHQHGPVGNGPARRFASEMLPRKPFPTHASEETASSSSERSLTAHALERHTREMGRPGPIPPSQVYDHYDRAMGPPPPPQQSHYYEHPLPSSHSHQPQLQSQQPQPPRVLYHAPPSYPQPQQQQPIEYHPPSHPPSQPRDSVNYEREPSMHSVRSMHSVHSMHSMHSMHSAPYDYYGHAHRSSVASGSDPRGYPDDRSSYSSNHAPSEPHHYQQQHSQQHQPPSQRLSLMAPESVSLQELVVPEDELMKSHPPPRPTETNMVLPDRLSMHRPSTPDEEAAKALAADAARLMQQQQDIQDQLQQRALSFSSETRFSGFDNDDENDEEEQGGVDGLEDWSTASPATRAMLNEFKTLDIKNEAPVQPRESYRHVAPTSDARLSMGMLSSHSGTSENQPQLENTRTCSPVQPTTLASAIDVTKLSVVQLYQKILELTKRQHALEIDANARAAEKDAVAFDLQALYKQLNEVTNQAEVAF